jgi:hypothetical protein
VIPLLGFYPMEHKTGYSRDTFTPMFITTIHNSQALETTRCPTIDEWIMKLSYICTMEYYSAIRNDDLWFEGKWMRLKDIMLSEVSQDQKHKRGMFSLIHGRQIQK